MSHSGYDPMPGEDKPVVQSPPGEQPPGYAPPQAPDVKPGGAPPGYSETDSKAIEDPAFLERIQKKQQATLLYLELQSNQEWMENYIRILQQDIPTVQMMRDNIDERYRVGRKLIAQHQANIQAYTQQQATHDTKQAKAALQEATKNLQSTETSIKHVQATESAYQAETIHMVGMGIGGDGLPMHHDDFADLNSYRTGRYFKSIDGFNEQLIAHRKACDSLYRHLLLGTDPSTDIISAENTLKVFYALKQDLLREEEAALKRCNTTPPNSYIRIGRNPQNDPNCNRPIWERAPLICWVERNKNMLNATNDIKALANNPPPPPLIPQDILKAKFDLLSQGFISQTEHLSQSKIRLAQRIAEVKIFAENQLAQQVKAGESLVAELKTNPAHTAHLPRVQARLTPLQELAQEARLHIQFLEDHRRELDKIELNTIFQKLLILKSASMDSLTLHILAAGEKTLGALQTTLQSLIEQNAIKIAHLTKTINNLEAIIKTLEEDLTPRLKEIESLVERQAKTELTRQLFDKKLNPEETELLETAIKNNLRKNLKDEKGVTVLEAQLRNNRLKNHHLNTFRDQVKALSAAYQAMVNELLPMKLLPEVELQEHEAKEKKREEQEEVGRVSVSAFPEVVKPPKPQEEGKPSAPIVASGSSKPQGPPGGAPVNAKAPTAASAGATAYAVLPASDFPTEGSTSQPVPPIVTPPSQREQPVADAKLQEAQNALKAQAQAFEALKAQFEQLKRQSDLEKKALEEKLRASVEREEEARKESDRITEGSDLQAVQIARLTQEVYTLRASEEKASDSANDMLSIVDDLQAKLQAAAAKEEKTQQQLNTLKSRIADQATRRRMLPGVDVVPSRETKDASLKSHGLFTQARDNPHQYQKKESIAKFKNLVKRAVTVSKLRTEKQKIMGLIEQPDIEYKLLADCQNRSKAITFIADLAKKKKSTRAHIEAIKTLDLAVQSALKETKGLSSNNPQFQEKLEDVVEDAYARLQENPITAAKIAKQFHADLGSLKQQFEGSAQTKGRALR